MEGYANPQLIGKGNYGTAYLCQDVNNDNEKVVVKKISLFSLSEKEKMDAYNECKLLKKVNHPNIIKYIDSFIEDDTLHIVTQYCDQGDLSSAIRKNKEMNLYFEEDVIIDWFVQITMAVDYIHSMKIMHRDIKTGNIFLSKNNVIKLGDFGIAKVLDSTSDQAKTVIGTPCYISPEVCESKPYDFKSDIWSMGCVLYELCTFTKPFESSNILALARKICQDDYPPLPDRYSDNLKNLVRKLLSKDPKQRPSCGRIFKMPFIFKILSKLAQNITSSDESASQTISSKYDKNLSAIPSMAFSADAISSSSGDSISISTMSATSSSVNALNLEVQTEKIPGINRAMSNEFYPDSTSFVPSSEFSPPIQTQAKKQSKHKRGIDDSSSIRRSSSMSSGAILFNVPSKKPVISHDDETETNVPPSPRTTKRAIQDSPGSAKNLAPSSISLAPVSASSSARIFEKFDTDIQLTGSKIRAMSGDVDSEAHVSTKRASRHRRGVGDDSSVKRTSSMSSGAILLHGTQNIYDDIDVHDSYIKRVSSPQSSKRSLMDSPSMVTSDSSRSISSFSALGASSYSLPVSAAAGGSSRRLDLIDTDKLPNGGMMQRTMSEDFIPDNIQSLAPSSSTTSLSTLAKKQSKHKRGVDDSSSIKRSSSMSSGAILFHAPSNSSLMSEGENYRKSVRSPQGSLRSMYDPPPSPSVAQQNRGRTPKSANGSARNLEESFNSQEYEIAPNFEPNSLRFPPVGVSPPATDSSSTIYNGSFSRPSTLNLAPIAATVGKGRPNASST